MQLSISTSTPKKAPSWARGQISIGSLEPVLVGVRVVGICLGVSGDGWSYRSVTKWKMLCIVGELSERMYMPFGKVLLSDICSFIFRCGL